MAAKAATAKAAVVAKAATKVATVGMRLKLSVVAASVALVGGFGVALGPVLSYFLPSVHADGQGVDRSQLTLISSGSGGPSGPTGSSASGARSSSTDRATTTRDQA